MIETKLFEIRDSMTSIAVLATRICPKEDDQVSELRMLGSSGYMRGSSYVLHHLSTGVVYQNSYQWNNVTMTFAHNYIATYWELLPAGSMIDVGYLRGAYNALQEPNLSVLEGQDKHHFKRPSED